MRLKLVGGAIKVFSVDELTKLRRDKAMVNTGSTSVQGNQAGINCP